MILVARDSARHSGPMRGSIARSSKHGYDAVLADVVSLVEAARGAAARSVNAVMTATYWAIGRRIVEHEQGGAQRAAYGEELLKRLAKDLSTKIGRGFSERNLEQRRRFFLTWSIPQTPSAKLLPAPDVVRAISQTASAPSFPAHAFPFTLVPLRQVAQRGQPAGPAVLRDRGASWRLDGPPTRSPDRKPVL